MAILPVRKQRLLRHLFLLIGPTLIFAFMTLNNYHSDCSLRQLSFLNAQDSSKTYQGSIVKSTSAKLRLSTPPSPRKKRRKRQIYAEFKSRFGNNLFQFAAIYGLAMDTNSESHFKRNRQARRIFTMFPTTAKSIHLVASIPENVSTVQELAPNQFTHKVEERIHSLNNDVYVKGWLGVYGYWWPKYEKQLREIFTISQKLQKRASDYFFEIAARIIPSSLLDLRRNKTIAGMSRNTGADGVTLVGIQIRRGDKVIAKDGWRVPGKSYFIHAMDYFKSKYNNTYFIVVSEDKKWAKVNIDGANVVHSSSKDDLLELTLLSLCDHTIMSVGTYSWWAAWLADGETVYYKHHTKPNTTVARFFNDTQYFLPHWIPMD